jgi:hypothetical protein
VKDGFCGVHPYHWIAYSDLQYQLHYHNSESFVKPNNSSENTQTSSASFTSTVTLDSIFTPSLSPILLPQDEPIPFLDPLLFGLGYPSRGVSFSAVFNALLPPSKDLKLPADENYTLKLTLTSNIPIIGNFLWERKGKKRREEMKKKKGGWKLGGENRVNKKKSSMTVVQKDSGTHFTKLRREYLVKKTVSKNRLNQDNGGSAKKNVLDKQENIEKNKDKNSDSSSDGVTDKTS